MNDADAMRVWVGDEEWAAIRSVASEIVLLRAVHDGNDRRFVNAALSVMVGDCHWMSLPAEQFGDWKSNRSRNERWIERGVWAHLAERGAVAEDWSRKIAERSDRHRRQKQRRATRRRVKLLDDDRWE